MSSSVKGKFVIRPFRPKNSMDQAAAQVIWKALSCAIDEIHNKNASALSFEELYRNAYNLVLHKHGDLLYDGVKNSVQTHLNHMAVVISTTTDDHLLQELSSRWNDHQVTMQMVRDILMYMDRTYVSTNKKTAVYDLGLALFRNTIARHVDVKDRLQELLLKNIAEERQGQLIDRNLMKTTLAMLVDLGVDGTAVYEEDFERSFLQTTRQFYQSESQDYISRNTCPDYMRKAEARLNEEAARATQYLAASTGPKLSYIVETELIARHAQALVDMENSGCIPMFNDDKLEDLRRMYELFQRVPATLDHLRGAMCAHVKRTGRELVADQENGTDPVVFVKELLALRDKYDNIVTQSFKSGKKAQKRLKEAFEDFINTDSRCARYLAMYVDELLKSGLRGMPEAEAEASLEKVIVVFRYIQDKDVFENFYKQYLAKRLLSGRSVSDEMERNMIALLKTECGYQFTSKLEGMFTDMRMSKDTMEQWRAVRAAPETGGMELLVDVLTTGYWPSQSGKQCTLPPVVAKKCEVFEEFYLHKHTGRKMSWQTSLGSCDMLATFGGGEGRSGAPRRYTLIVSTYQMCVLLLFNKSASVTFGQMKQALQMAEASEAELGRHVISLCTPKARILRKASKGKGISGDDDSFVINEDMNSKLKRIRVPLVSLRDSSSAAAGAGRAGAGGEGAALPASVEEDRRHLCEAAVVRIMKTRKTLQHNDLVAEVTRQLSSRFAPSPQLIKSRIESLIEREYLERGADNVRVYNYLA